MPNLLNLTHTTGEDSNHRSLSRKGNAPGCGAGATLKLTTAVQPPCIETPRARRTPRRKEIRPSSPCSLRDGSPDCGRRISYVQSARSRRTYCQHQPDWTGEQLQHRLGHGSQKIALPSFLSSSASTKEPLQKPAA